MPKVISEEEQTQQTATAEDSENDSATMPSLAMLIKAVSDKLNADMFLYSGDLDRDGATWFIGVTEQYKNKENVVLILTTYGGTADAAYKMARHLKRTYQRFTLCIFGPCKSAGTLLAQARSR